MEKKTCRNLTEEEKRKIVFAVNDLLSEDLPEEPAGNGVLMKQKLEEFTAHLLHKDDPSEIASLLEICEDYIKRKETGEQDISDMALLVLFDMWLNKSSRWPVPKGAWHR